VPQSGLVLGGSGGNRTLSVTPARDQVGQATITLTVSDGAATASDVFVLTVTGSPAGGTTPNYLLVENFEGPGYESPGWWEVGNPSETSRSKLEGRYALNTAKGSQAYRLTSGATNVYLYFMLTWKNTTQTHTLVDLSDSTGQPAGFLWVTGSELRLSHGTSTASAAFNYSNRGNYHIWLEWKRGSGTDGTMQVFVSSTGQKPSAPMTDLTNGNGTAVEQLYFGGAAPDSPSLVFDKIRLADGPIGSNPQ
jgi:hypothetical protein